MFLFSARKSVKPIRILIKSHHFSSNSQKKHSRLSTWERNHSFYEKNIEVVKSQPRICQSISFRMHQQLKKDPILVSEEDPRAQRETHGTLLRNKGANFPRQRATRPNKTDDSSRIYVKGAHFLVLRGSFRALRPRPRFGIHRLHHHLLLLSALKERWRRKVCKPQQPNATPHDNRITNNIDVNPEENKYETVFGPGERSHSLVGAGGLNAIERKTAEEGTPDAIDGRGKKRWGGGSLRWLKGDRFSFRHLSLKLNCVFFWAHSERGGFYGEDARCRGRLCHPSSLSLSFASAGFRWLTAKQQRLEDCGAGGVRVTRSVAHGSMVRRGWALSRRRLRRWLLPRGLLVSCFLFLFRVFCFWNQNWES